MYKILITCPPMINRINNIRHLFLENDMEYYIPPNLQQTLDENEILKIISDFDIWIVGDDIVNHNILKNSKLKILIKWGVGIDNIDLKACGEFGIRFMNTPGMFSEEVSDVAIGYMIMLGRELHNIHNQVFIGKWYKPMGISFYDKKVGLIGYGNIGQTLCRKLLAFNIKINVYDPLYHNEGLNNEDIIFMDTLKDCLEDVDIIICTCALTNETKYMIDKESIQYAKKGVYIINVSRGAVIKENDLIELLENGYVKGVALDVFEKEPLEMNSLLKNYNCIFGSHNASNTLEAVDRVNRKVIDLIIYLKNCWK